MLSNWDRFGKVDENAGLSTHNGVGEVQWSLTFAFCIANRDICDIDKDGNMDFDEFCLALRFMYASINGEIAEIPSTLPAHMIPPSKAQYFGGQGFNQSFMQQSGSYMNQNQNQNYSQASNYSAISDLVREERGSPPTMSLKSKIYDLSD